MPNVRSLGKNGTRSFCSILTVEMNVDPDIILTGICFIYLLNIPESDIMLEEGDKAIDFTLDSTEGTFTLSERVRKGPVLLYFYVVNYGKTCTDYIALMNERIDEFRRYNVSLVHINEDTVENHRAWINHTDSQFEHLSDPGEEVSRKYDCIIKQARSEKLIGRVNRCFFLIDKDMTIRWAWRAEWPYNTVPMDEIFDKIREL